MSHRRGQSLPPAAIESLRQPKREKRGGLAGLLDELTGGRPSTETALLDTALPKHLELQGHEIARLGQSVRQLAGAGQYAEALEAARQRLSLTEQTYGHEHILTATCLNDVATFVQAYGRFDEAEALFERASRLQRKLLGDVHPHSIATLQNLVSLYAAKGDEQKKEGMEFLVKALQTSAAAQGSS